MTDANIRNFCILAHIDHGKSTLADRMLEITGTIPAREMREQFLDMNPLERERGITIKMQPVRMNYKLNSASYILDLIDTPGHVDFSYEVSRALAAVEGAVMLVDATQGVQAQTIANLRMAIAEGLKIIPVVNKVDLPTARIEETREEIRMLLSGEGIEIADKDILEVSGKTGKGVERLLEEVIAKVPPPDSDRALISGRWPVLRALIFDSHFDSYKGAIAYVRIVGGTVKAGDKIRFMASRAEVEVLETGFFIPRLKVTEKLEQGEIGYIATGIKVPEQVRVGDTITNSQIPKTNFQTENVKSLAGYKDPQPMVWASVYPEDADDFDELKDAVGKLKLNDASFQFEIESSEALGRGFRCGFLGTLHLEIISERLRREYNLQLIVTTPSVAYKVNYAGGREEMIFRASSLPAPGKEKWEILEPWASLEIITPAEHLGPITSLLHEHRAIAGNTKNLGERVIIEFEAPLAEIIVDLHDKLKSATHGFASMEYSMRDWRLGDLTRVNILVAEREVAAFARIVPRERAEREGRAVLLRLKELMPRSLFPIALQAEIGGKIVARETIPALKKDVTGYLYGGDRTRKMKLWKKQQRGKKKLKELGAGAVEIPSEVFLKILKSD